MGSERLDALVQDAYDKMDSGETDCWEHNLIVLRSALATARREALEEAEMVAVETIRVSSTNGLDGKVSAAIRALIDTPESPAR